MPDTFDGISLTKAIFRIDFEGKILSKTQPTILLQILCESMTNSKVTFKSTKGSDDTCPKRSSSVNGLKTSQIRFDSCDLIIENADGVSSAATAVAIDSVHVCSSKFY